MILSSLRFCVLILDAVFGCAVRVGLAEGRGRVETCCGVRLRFSLTPQKGNGDPKTRSCRVTL